MARRTRRQARVVWLPQDPFFSVDAAGAAGSTVMRISDTNPGLSAGDTTTVVAPVVRDVAPNPLTPANTLSDIENSGYRLRRIVGKFWCYLRQGDFENLGAGAVVVTAGFIILRTQSQTGTPLGVEDEYQTNAILNTSDPWIWRRSWLLADNQSFNSVPFGDPGTAVQAVGFGPGSNVQMTGVLDGPHIDQKTARIVGPDERLFLVITNTALTGGNQGAPLLLDYVYDVRVLASLRSNMGNRGNASR